MVTIGRGVYAPAVHEFFEGIRSYDVERAVAVLAEDADFKTPWTDGVVTGRAKIKEILERDLNDASKRPSYSIMDISGDGNITTMKVSISGRFGRAAKPYVFKILNLKGVIHQVIVTPA